MNRTARTVTAAAVTYVLVGCSSAETPDAGPSADAGFHYTALPVGTATFSGALSGTWGATALAFSNPMGMPLLDGGNSGPYVYFQITSAISTPGPVWGCQFDLFSSTLAAGSYTETNVNWLLCDIVIYLPDGGTGEEWFVGLGGTFGPPNIFALNLTSPGPASGNASDTNWDDPSATLNLYLTPNPGDAEGVVITATVAPPPCPEFCAPGPP